MVNGLPKMMSLIIMSALLLGAASAACACAGDVAAIPTWCCAWESTKPPTMLHGAPAFTRIVYREE